MALNQSVLKLIEQLLLNERESLIEDIVSRVREELESINSHSTSKVLVTTDELVEIFSISKSTIIKLRKQGMPFIQIGDAIRFDVIEVTNYLNKNFKT